MLDETLENVAVLKSLALKVNMSHQVYLGLGSNLENPAKQIQQAVHALSEINEFIALAVSSLYFSRPMGPQDQPDYMNAVLLVETHLDPDQVLSHTQKIELDAGRVRKGDRWGARILDVDILLYDHETIDTPDLIIPHYGMKEREFVLLPLAELAPTLLLPCGANVQELATNIPKNGLKIHSQLSLNQ